MGINPREWEAMTPVELNIYARAYVSRRKEEQKISQVNIYSLAALVRSMIWSKHPPSFERTFSEAQTDKPQEQMTDDQMYAMVKGLNALFGGEEAD